MKRAPLLSMLLLFACKGQQFSDVVDPGSQTGGTDGECELTLSAAGAAPDPAVLFVDVADSTLPFAQRKLFMRALDITPGGLVTLSVQGPFELLNLSGAEGPTTALDVTSVLLASDAAGAGSLTLQAEGCAPVELALVSRPPPPLVGHGLVDAPFFDFVSAFNTDETVEVALSDTTHGDRVGMSFDAYVVPHRTLEEWGTDNSLADAVSGPLSGTMAAGGWQNNQLVVWDGELQVNDGELATNYDLVLDFGSDGNADPGDLVQGLQGIGLYTIRDLTENGPYGVQMGYHSVSYWNTMDVFTPTTPPPEPVPLVVISHGNGHDYDWYAYLGNHFASWGYAVISHRNDTGPGPVTAAGTTLSNTEVFLRDAGTLGLPVTVDSSRIAFIGHSRGGEGVAIAYRSLTNNGGGVSQFSATDVRLVQSIAPTIFEGPDGTDTSDAPLHVLAGTADGDVTGGVDWPDLQYFRMFLRGTADHWVTTVHGADHNDFNCCGADDGNWGTVAGNPPLIGRERAQNVAMSYLLVLLEATLHDDPRLTAYFRRPPELFRPVGAEAYIATQSMPGVNTDKWVLDDFQLSPEIEVSSSGGAVTITATNAAEGALDDGNTTLNFNNSDPSNGMTWSSDDSQPERGLVLDWTAADDTSAEWTVVAGQQDWSAWQALSMRICQGTRHGATTTLDDMLSFTVALIDGAGHEVGIDFGGSGRIPEPYPREGLGNGSGWVNEFQTVRLDLSEFAGADPSLDLANIVALKLRFGDTNGSSNGRIGLDDIELLAEGTR
jgi:hypothetical protein